MIVQLITPMLAPMNALRRLRLRTMSQLQASWQLWVVVCVLSVYLSSCAQNDAEMQRIPTLTELLQRDITSRAHASESDIVGIGRPFSRASDRDAGISAVSDAIISTADSTKLRCLLVEFYSYGQGGVESYGARLVIAHHDDDFDMIARVVLKLHSEEVAARWFFEDFLSVSTVPFQTWKAGDRIAEYLVSTQLRDRFSPAADALRFYLVSTFDGTRWQSRAFEAVDVEHPPSWYVGPNRSSALDSGASGVGAAFHMLFEYVGWLDHIESGRDDPSIYPDLLRGKSDAP